jgi:hypothetical protein
MPLEISKKLSAKMDSQALKSNKKYLSLADAAKLSSYSQEYLSLRARQAKLKAEKHGRNWVTTQEWLEEYVQRNLKSQIPLTPNSQPLTGKEINYPLLARKLGCGFLILLLGFGLLKVSPSMIDWTAQGVADVSRWLIETGKILEQ